MNPNQLAAMLGAWARSVPRLEGAACRGNPDPFDVDVRAGRAAIDAAIEMCLACPTMLACSAWVDGLPADQKPRGVVGGRLVDPDAPTYARPLMTAELAARRPKPPRQAKRSGGPRRLRATLLAAVDHAGLEGLTVREAAAALYGPTPTGTQVELARQAIQRQIARGVLVRVDGGGRARYAAAQIAVAS